MYLLSCGNCPAVYIDETGLSFTTRFPEHRWSTFENGKPTKSAFARHLIDHGHALGREDILHVENNFRRRLALENIEIGKHTVWDGDEVINRKVNISRLINNIFCISPYYECTELSGHRFVMFISVLRFISYFAFAILLHPLVVTRHTPKMVVL